VNDGLGGHGCCEEGLEAGAELVVCELPEGYGAVYSVDDCDAVLAGSGGWAGVVVLGGSSGGRSVEEDLLDNEKRAGDIGGVGSLLLEDLVVVEEAVGTGSDGGDGANLAVDYAGLR